jgi:hypothetical protein
VNHTTLVILASLLAAALVVGGIVATTTRAAFAHNDDGENGHTNISGTVIFTGETGPPGSPCPSTTNLFEEPEGNRRDKVGSFDNPDQLVCIL